MITLLTLAAANTFIAGTIAVVALLATRLTRRPALAHTLWLLVLVKLVTPPIWSIAIAIPSNHPTLPVFETTRGAEPARFETPVRQPSEIEDFVPTVHARTAEPTLNRPISTRSFFFLLPAVLIGLWLVGSLTCGVIAVIRLRWLRRVLGFATPAPADVLAKADLLAQRIGLSHSPPVWFIPASVSPMLLALPGNTRLIIPERLWQSLDSAPRDSLLLHELAHLKRRDHWVRGFELVVTILYWWNPLVWFARRQLRIQEELCCDAWVTWAMPGGADDYAAALVEAVDFAAGSRLGLPALASGMGEFKHLQRRLLMIRNGTGNRKLGWTAIIAWAALIALPLSLTNAQQQARPAMVVAADKTSTVVDPQESVVKETSLDLAVQARLDRIIPDLQLSNAPLSKVFGTLEQVSGLLFTVDWKSLENAGIHRDKSITLYVNDVKFSKILSLILANASVDADNHNQLVYDFNNAVINIYAKPQTPSQRASAQLTAKPPAASLTESEPVERIRQQGETAQDRLVREQLNQSITQVRFNNKPLSEAIDAIRQETEASLFVSWEELGRVGVNGKTPVTLNVHDVKISKALTYILNSAANHAAKGQARLNFEIKDGFVVISTEGEPAKNTWTRVYDVRDILGNTVGDEREKAAAALIRTVTETVDELSWRDNGGAAASIQELQGCLIISQTPENQHQVLDLLERLRHNAGRMPTTQRAFPLLRP